MMMLNATSHHLPYGGNLSIFESTEKSKNPKLNIEKSLFEELNLKPLFEDEPFSLTSLIPFRLFHSMDEPGSDPDPGSYPIPPASVHLAPFFSSLVPPLSAHFTRRCQPLQSSRPLAYISLQGLLVNFDEASSARSIGGGLSREEALAWELFTPYQRFLIVAVIGVAAAESKKNGLIRQLQKSVDLRVSVVDSLIYLLEI